MKDLKQCRIEIDEIDQQLMELFEKRMSLSKSVVEYKIANHLEIFQPEREREVIEKNLNRLENENLKEYARCFIQEMMTVSKSYQSDLLPLELDKNIKTEFKKDPLVGYQGIAGAFSQSAVENFFGEGTRNIGYKDFEDVYVALENGEFDYAMSILKSNNGNGAACNRYTFAYENAIAGEGHFIHTYKCDGNPLPSFEGEPKLVAIPDDMDAFTDLLWNNLNEDNKVSLFVRYINLENGTYKTKIVNKNINTYEKENGLEVYVTYEVLESIGTNEKIVF